jgi:hypothetical protein
MTPEQQDAVRRAARETTDPALRAELEAVLTQPQCLPPPLEPEAPANGLYRYDIDLMTDVREFTCRGKSFKVACFEGDGIYHPSIWSHMDEVETREAWWAIEPGDVVFDIGADFGSYTLPALAMGAAQVHAWSPPFKLPTEPLEQYTLMESADLNGWGRQCRVYPTGLWSAEGWLASFDGPRPARFFPGDHGPNWDMVAANASFTKGAKEAAAAIEGQPGHCSAFWVQTLDDYCRWACPSEGRTWIKIDTEGAEEEILKGARRTIAERQPTILLEYHELTMPGCEARLDAMLADMGYEKVDRRPHHTIAHGLYKPRVE